MPSCYILGSHTTNWPVISVNSNQMEKHRMKTKSFASFIANKPVLYETPLSVATLKKPHRQRAEDDPEYLRGDTFLRKYKEGEPFTVARGDGSVTLEVEPDKLEQLEQMKQNRNYDPIRKMTFKDVDGNPIKITDLAKDADFGSSRGQGGGAAQTAQMEALQCWYCAAAFDDFPLGLHGKEKMSGFDELQLQLKSIKKQIFGTEVDPTQKQDKKWDLTLVNTANLLAHHFKIQSKRFNFHHGSDMVKHIMALFSAANMNGGKPFGGKDKWNPADIWICAAGKEAEIMKFAADKAAKKALTFEELNAQILDWFHTQTLVGVSLKKLSDNGEVHVFNESKESSVDITFDKVYSTGKNLASNKDVILSIIAGTTYYKIIFRTFGDAATSWCGEIKGKAAMAGKIGTGIVIRALTDVGYDIGLSAVKNMSRESMVNEILALNKTLHFREDETDAEEMIKKEMQWLYSKVLGMRLAVFFEKHPDKVDDFCREVFHYAFSSHSLSSVFLKVSS